MTNIQGCISKDHSRDVVEEFYWSKNFLFTILLLLRSSSTERCVSLPTSTGFGSYENLFPDVSKKRKMYLAMVKQNILITADWSSSSRSM